MNEFNSECFPIGLCEYPVQIEYDQFDDGDIEIQVCRIEVAAGDFQVWAKVDTEYFPSIERQLKKELDEDGIVTPDSEVANWPKFLHRQAS
jgi:hypothetical protein